MEDFNVIRKLAIISNLTKTDIEILRILHEKKRLLISDISKYIKRSERHVRQRLKNLLEKKFLRRKIEVLENKRLAYSYSLRSIPSIINETRNMLRKKIEELDKLIAE